MKELTILNSFCLHVTPAVQEGEQHPVSEVCFIFKNNKYFAYLVPYSFLFSSFSLSLYASLSSGFYSIIKIMVITERAPGEMDGRHRSDNSMYRTHTCTSLLIKSTHAPSHFTCNVMHMYISCTPSIYDLRFSSTHEFILSRMAIMISYMCTYCIVYTSTSA